MCGIYDIYNDAGLSNYLWAFENGGLCLKIAVIPKRVIEYFR